MAREFDVVDWVFEIGARGLRPDPDLTVSEWADTYRVLTSVSSPEPGPWKTSRVPFMEEIMDALSANSPYQMVVFMKGSQIAGPLAIDTPIPTPTGWKTMGDLKAGDEVFDEKGKPIKVLGASEIFRGKPCVKITFSDGAEVVCDTDHLWTVWDEKKYAYRKLRTIRTAEIAQTFKCGKSKVRNRYAIDLHPGLELHDIELPIAPYALGVWLGDGNSASAQVTTHQDDADEMASYIQAVGHEAIVRRPAWCKGLVMNIMLDPKIGAGDICIRGHDKRVVGLTTGRGQCAECQRQHSMKSQYGKPLDPVVYPYPETFFGKLTRLDLVRNKHIPPIYLRASYRQRLELLQGLMDTDGSISKAYRRCDFSTSSKRLSEDVFELLTSLGLKPTVAVTISDRGYSGGPRQSAPVEHYRHSFLAYSTTPVFKLKRKLELQPQETGRRTTETKRRRIVDVAPVESVPVRCISVNSESHLFLAGRSMIPTHNTEAGLNWIGYVVDQAPGPMLYVLPTEQIAKDYSKTRIDPLIEESEALRGKVKEARSRDSGNTTLLKEFAGGYLSLIGANSGAALRGKPIRYLFVDELDAFPGNVNGEGDPFNLAVVRTRNFGRRKKIFANSSPKIKGRSRIEALYDKTDKRRYFVPCPECGRMQYLRWGQVKWDKHVPVDKQHETAYYECESCETRIFNHQKTEMLARGKWRGTRADAPSNVAGFHLSALYSPVGWMSWQDCVRQFLDSKHDRELLRVFVNTVLGETFEEHGDAPEWKQLYHRREKYPLSKLPRRALILTAGVDVQKDRLEAHLVAWGRGLESWIIDYRVMAGDPAQPGVWTRLDELLLESFEHESGLHVPIRMLAIDAGYETHAVYRWARRYPTSRVIAVKGQDSLSAILGPPRSQDVNIDGKKARRGIKMWPVGVSLLKEELYGRLRYPAPDPDGSPSPGYIHFPEELTEEYFKQLTSEHLVPIRQKSGTKYEWQLLDGRRNEALDTWNYARAAATHLSLDRYTDAHWTALERQFPGTGDSSPPTPSAPSSPPPAPAAPASSVARRGGRRVFSRGASM